MAVPDGVNYFYGFGPTDSNHGYASYSRRSRNGTDIVALLGINYIVHRKFVVLSKAGKMRGGATR